METVRFGKEYHNYFSKSTFLLVFKVFHMREWLLHQLTTSLEVHVSERYLKSHIFSFYLGDSLSLKCSPRHKSCFHLELTKLHKEEETVSKALISCQDESRSYLLIPSHAFGPRRCFLVILLGSESHSRTEEAVCCDRHTPQE